MINPKELRIGNWITFDKGSHKVQVTNIGIGLPLIELDQLWYTSKAIKGSHHDFSAFSPIELTGEFLQLIGFKKRCLFGYEGHYLYHYYFGGELIKITALYDSDFSITINTTVRKIKFLHDLQNKIFAITGKELEISF